MCSSFEGTNEEKSARREFKEEERGIAARAE